MYALSQYQAAPVSHMNSPFHSSAYNRLYNRLESMAHAEYEPSAIAYSIQSFPQPQVYGASTTSFSSSLSSPTSFHYSSEQERLGYNAAGSSVAYSILAPAHTEYHFHPEEFLKPGKEGKFIGQAEEIKEYIVDAFEKIFHTKFPNNIFISVCNEKEFRKIAPHPGTIGLSVNRGKEGLISEIFILNDSLARVMLTIGHELGHVLTETLDNPHDEEAKAYAFSLLWMNAIKEHDIAGLSDAIVTERPAENGLHNVAFRWVEKLLKTGKRAAEVYTQLIRKSLSISESFM